MRRLLAASAAAILAACGGGSSSPRPPACEPPGALAPDGAPPAKLSQLCLLSAEGNGAVAPHAGVLPFELNTPLFSDYALKYRTVWLPPGTQGAYAAHRAMDLPPGAVVTKTFSFPADLRAPGVDVRLVETRVLVRGAAGWRGFAYVWDADQRDATFAPGGARIPIAFTSPSGERLTASYLVPSMSQCQRCHADEEGGALHLLGPTARNLNRPYAYEDGEENQLARWTSAGLLAGTPPPEEWPRLPAWGDASGTWTVEQRARAWLEVNCANCHNPGGMARTSGLHLGTEVDLATPAGRAAFGFCKAPVAAGAGTGGRLYDVVPGQPDASILLYRIETTDPAAMMPELGRSVTHAEGAALVRAWIAGLTGDCP